MDFENSRAYQLKWLQEQGFDVVEHHLVTRDTVGDEVAWFAEHIRENEVPSDGLVLIYDDISYGRHLEQRQSFREIPLRLSGRMKCERRRSVRLNGVRPEQD